MTASHEIKRRLLLVSKAITNLDSILKSREITLPTDLWSGSNSGRQWRTEDPGVLQAMGLQRVRHDLVTEQQQEMVMSHLSGPGNCVSKKNPLLKVHNHRPALT